MRIFFPIGDGDWSNYALWWPDKQLWLNKPRQTLYAYGIMSNAQLEFACVHRQLVIELPDKSRYRMRIHLAMMTFYVVNEICTAFNIRHSEEMSLMKSPFDREGFVKSTGFHRVKVKKLHDPGSRETSPGYEGTDSGTPPSSPRKMRMPSIGTGLEPDQLGPGSMSTGAEILHQLPSAPDGGFFTEKLQRSVMEKAFINGL